MNLVEDKKSELSRPMRHGALIALLFATLLTALSEGVFAAVFAFSKGSCALAASAFFAGAATVALAALPVSFGIALVLAGKSARLFRRSLTRGLVGKSEGDAVALVLVFLVVCVSLLITIAVGKTLAHAVTLPFAALGEALVLVTSASILLLAAAPVGHTVTNLVRRSDRERNAPDIFLALCVAAAMVGGTAGATLPWQYVPTPVAAVLGAAISTLPPFRRLSRRFGRIGLLIVASIFVASALTLFFSNAFPGPVKHALEKSPIAGALFYLRQSL